MLSCKTRSFCQNEATAPVRLSKRTQPARSAISETNTGGLEIGLSLYFSLLFTGRRLIWM